MYTLKLQLPDKVFPALVFLKFNYNYLEFGEDIITVLTKETEPFLNLFKITRQSR